MANNSSPSSYMWPNGLTLILAVWLFISPWVLGFASPGHPAWNAWIVGIIVAAVSITALRQMAQWEDWVSLILGAWLFISPWVLGFNHVANAAADAWIVGILFFVIGIWGVWVVRQDGGLHPQTH